MKKTTVLLIAFGLLLLSFLLCACNSAVDTEEAYVYKNDLSPDEQSFLKNQTRYRCFNEELQDFLFTDQPFIRVSPALAWSDAERTLHSFMNESFYKDISFFLVFEERPVIMQRFGQEGDQIKLSLANQSAAWVRDLINLRQTTEILGVQCRINDLFCTYTNDSTGCQGVFLYFDTDQGVFVRYYKSVQTEDAGEWFTEQDFVGYVQLYTRYLRDNAYNDNGERLFGQMAFREYLNLIRTQEKHES